MFVQISELKSWQKNAIVIAHDLIVVVAALVLAVFARFGTLDVQQISSVFNLTTFVLFLFSQFVVLYLLGLYRGVWRYSSIADLTRVIKASTLAVLVSFIVVFFATRLESVPRSMFLINWTFLIMGLGGGRLVYRVFREQTISMDDKKRIIIVGAGAGGEQLFREIQKNATLGLFVEGFVDDSPYLRKKYLHGRPVLGTTEDLPRLLKAHQIRHVYIAMPSADSATIRRIYNLIKPTEAKIKILPQLSKILYEKISIQSLEAIKIEDLLGREEVNLDMQLLEKMLTNKRVLITGAGGSIGSGLTEQLARFKPERLVGVDFSEFNVYELDQRLNSEFSDLNFHCMVADVRDEASMNALFERERPEVVLHAAAYKHVPIMEFNPYEAIKTNVFGTKIIAELAVKYKSDRFVLISTDKAVNPTNVMGCTKRIAEMVVQQIQKETKHTKLMTVRFGNVLGSSGSVIPLFRKQIEAGGPLTVTHADITRYFMSIPEATKLVLQAGAMGSGGELFVLDMGEPVKILDLAKDMIRLAGLHEGLDIKIQVVGLRPGEKLYEEPLISSESTLETVHPKVKVCLAREVSAEFFESLKLMQEMKPFHKRELALELMQGMVPEYEPHQDSLESKSIH
jgi:FlaA1/EpsC-like NDP-sugar epimerase